MKIKLSKDMILGESSVIDERLQNIYGVGLYEQEKKRIQEENKKKYLIAVVFLTFMIIISLISGSMNKSLIQNSKGDVEGISNVNGTVNSVPIQISGVWDGEEFTKEVILDMSQKTQKDDDENPMENEGMEEEIKALELDTMINEIVEKINKSFHGKNMALPSRLKDGTKITWHSEKTNYLIPIVLVAVILMYGIYRKRFDPIKKLEIAANESVLEELPGFLNKLALLMNAGLVFGSAYERIIDEKVKIGWGKDSYFYNQLIKINENVKERNCSIQKELADFATRSQNKEFIRAVGIINDNINKGIMLTDKLRGESEALWFAQKKYIEEKSKVAETKLVGPLFIILGILIVITMVPAMMGM